MIEITPVCGNELQSGYVHEGVALRQVHLIGGVPSISVQSIQI